MIEFAKGVKLFFTSWLVLLVFYFLSLLVFVQDFLQRLFDTGDFSIEAGIVNLLLVMCVTYLVNRKVIKANMKTFKLSQLLFILSVGGFFILAVLSIAKDIMMNA